MIFENIIQYVTLYFLVHVNLGMTLYVGRRSQELNSVPQDIDALVTELDLNNNKITRVANVSLMIYRELRVTSINVMRSPTELKMLALCVVHPFLHSGPAGDGRAAPVARGVRM